MASSSISAAVFSIASIVLDLCHHKLPVNLRKSACIFIYQTALSRLWGDGRILGQCKSRIQLKLYLDGTCLAALVAAQIYGSLAFRAASRIALCQKRGTCRIAGVEKLLLAVGIGIPHLHGNFLQKFVLKSTLLSRKSLHIKLPCLVAVVFNV